jgi:hypothetical protein
MSDQTFRYPFLVQSDGGLLAATLHRPTSDLAVPTPGLVASGSWLTVKEQMADLYAEHLVRRGYTVLTFDFTGFGQSSGAPRQTEMPLRKISDILAATRFLAGLSCVRGGTVGYVGICASAMYAAAAAGQGAPIAAFASIAGWFHDSATVAPFYGGADGVADRLARAADATEVFLMSGEIHRVPAYDEGNQRAGMFNHMDYYADPTRGRVGAWHNEMTEMTWAYWLTFDGISPAERLRIPTLFVHGDECALPDNVRRIHAALGANSELVWHPGFQTDYYDRPELVALSVDAADRLFQRSLAT